MSWALHPRLRSLAGRANPWRSGPDGHGAAQALGELVGDVAGVEVREDQHVGPARHGAARRLLADRREAMRAASACSSPSTARFGAFLLTMARAATHLVHAGMLGGAPGGEAQEGHAGLHAA